MDAKDMETPVICAKSYHMPHGKKDMKADMQHPHGSYQAERWAVVAGV